MPNGHVILSALGPGTGEELYRAVPGSRQLDLLDDIYPGPASSYPFYSVVLGEGVVFVATDPVHGRELWYADSGTGTRLLADIYSDASVNPSSSPEQLTPAGDQLFFVANDIAHGAELWVSNGTGETTRMVKDIFPGQPSSAPHSLAPAGATLYFSAEDGVNGFRLWRTDGTDAGTVLVDSKSEAPQHLTVLGDVVYYSAHRGEEGRELWCAGNDGPVLVKDIATGPRSSDPKNFAIFQGVVYFLADDGVHGEELWRSDGTAPGTVMVRDLVPVPYEPLRFSVLVPTENSLYLAGGSRKLGTELWQYDMAAQRPIAVKDIGAWEALDPLRPPAPRLRGD
jgi:ELWxxDGT repeat protein